jgi:membrane-associated phospholipid phosphatase
MERKIAKVISVIFHPLLIPTYAILLLINTNTHLTLVIPEKLRYITISMVFLTSFVLPSLIMLVLLKIGRIKSLEMVTRQERILPLLIVAVFFYLTYHLLKQGPYFLLFKIFMLGATLLVIISLFITYFTKISIHMLALGGMFGTFAGYSITFNLNLGFLLSLIVFVAGITGFARLKLEAHNPSQIYTGFALGTVFMLGLFLLI